MVKYLNFGNISTDLFAESDNFKLFMGDTGLLITQILRTSNIVQEDLYRKIITGHLGANLGMIFENMVAQMLRVRGYELFFHEYYYTPKGKKTEQKYEVEFLIAKDLTQDDDITFLPVYMTMCL